MERRKRSSRSGKRKFNDRNEGRQRKPKKSKFDFRKASYIKEREARNEEIEARRQMIEQKKARERLQESDVSEEEEEDPTLTLLSLLPNAKLPKRSAIETSSESDSSNEEINTQDEDDENEEITDLDGTKPDEAYNDSENEDIIVNVKEDDEEDAETAQEDAGHLRDPFSVHLRNDMDEKLYEAVSATPMITEIKELKWPTLGCLKIEIPKPAINSDNDISKTRLPLEDKKEFTSYGKIPSMIDTVDWNKLYVKSQIQNNLIRANDENIKMYAEEDSLLLTPLQKELFSVINNYQDLYYNERTFSNADQIRFVYCLHVINHVLKTRTKVLHHNAKLVKSSDIEIPDEYRDQGLVRPKVLIIVPFRHSCLKIVEQLISILIGEDKGGSVINKLRFMNEFSGNELTMPQKNPKPKDYELTFQGNIDDKFNIGIAITKKTLKLYTEFYSSDIIISSVLGLRMLIGAEGEADRDYDFLTSIELLILDQAELTVLQNWDHLFHVMDHLHLHPKANHDVDIFRLRNWCVNGWTKYYRQTMIFSDVDMLILRALLNRNCFNYAGKVKIDNPVESGLINQVIVCIPQVFYRFHASSMEESAEKRMECFIKKVLPSFKDSFRNHTLIYVPCYYQFVLIRNYMRKEELNFVHICEYSRDAKMARARDMFFHGDAHFLLYSGRCHFYRRMRIKGIRHIIFFAPPTLPHFYSEMCNLMQKWYQNPRGGSELDMTINVIYCEHDAPELNRIVGTKNFNKMLNSRRNDHTFMSQ